MISIENISKKFNSKQNFILKDISLKINNGNVIGIVGENGAGKTTLIKIMTGLILPNSGRVYYDDIELTKKNMRTLYKDISIVLDSGRALQWRLSVLDNFKYFATLKGLNNTEIDLNINKFVDMFEIHNLLNIKVNNLSLGQKQIVSIMIALINNSKYIFLDEPTNGLDLEFKLKLLKLIKKIKSDQLKTLIITTHDIEFLLNCSDKCLILDNGYAIKEINLKNEIFKNSYEYYKEKFYFKEK